MDKYWEETFKNKITIVGQGNCGFSHAIFLFC